MLSQESYRSWTASGLWMKKEKTKATPTHDKSNTTFSVVLPDISKVSITIGPQL